MTTAYTSLLGLALPVTGELSGTWGDTVNNSITSLLDSAIAGTTTITSDADVTLTTTTGSANTSRQAIILWTAGGTATRTIIAPAQSKIYTVINASSSTQSIILAGAGPTSGVTIAKGESALCAWNGSDFIKISNTAGPGTFTNLTVTGNTSLGDADTDTITQAASYVTGTQLKSAKTATNTLSLAAYDVDGTAYTNLITLTAGNTPTLALTSTGVGTINNMSIGATTASTGAFTTLSASSTVTLSGGTENGVAYLNGSKVLTTGSALTFSGTTLGLSSADSRFTLTSTGSGQTVGISIKGGAGGGDTFNFIESLNNDNTQAWYLGSNGTSNVLAFKVAGSEAMRLTSTSLYTASTINVGIGTSSPSSRLHVKGTDVKLTFETNTGATAYIQQLSAAPYNVSFVNQNAGSLIFGTNNAEKMYLDSSGRLGIGNTTPANYQAIANQLVVGSTGSNGITVVSGTTGTGNLFFSDGTNGTEGYRGVVQYDHSLDSMSLATSALARVTLDAEGRVGIGTTTPVMFNTTGSSSARMLTLFSTSTNSGGRSEFQIGTAATTSGDITGLIMFGCGASTTTTNATAIIYSELTASSTSVAYGALVFGTANGAAATERARIDSSGGFSSTTTAANYAYKATNSHASDPYGVQIIYSAANPNGTGNSFLYCNDSALRAQIRSDGGLANYSANNVNLSDRREKTNFAPAKSYLDVICAIPVQTFNYIDQNMEDDGGLTLGVVAQDVQAVAPELVMESDWAGKDEEPKMRLSIYQTDLQYALMKCIQEQQALIIQLTARITALESA
jgi:hypothetical protein